MARERELDDPLAVARAGHRGERVVGVGAAADDGGVPHAAGELQLHPARRRRGCEVSTRVARHGADRPRVRAGGAAPRRIPARALPRRHEERVVVRGDPDLAGERGGARAGEEHVVRSLHDRARERDRVPHVLHDRHRAAAERRAVHDRGVELHVSGGGERRAGAGVERRVVLEHPHCGLDRFERAAAGAKDRPARFAGEANPAGAIRRCGSASARPPRGPSRAWRRCASAGAKSQDAPG